MYLVSWGAPANTAQGLAPWQGRGNAKIADLCRVAQQQHVEGLQIEMRHRRAGGVQSLHTKNRTVSHRTVFVCMQRPGRMFSTWQWGIDQSDG